jgi:MFS family permease
VQIHQTKYLEEIGFSPTLAAWALGLVSFVAIPGQIALGHLSDRIGREWVWTIGNAGFAICYFALILLQDVPSLWLLYVMVIAQGLLGYGLTSVLGALTLEIFQGAHFGSIYGTLTVSVLAGGAVGPWITGLLHDSTGNYTLAFWIAIVLSAVSAIAMWLAGPRKVRAVAGRMKVAAG